MPTKNFITVFSFLSLSILFELLSFILRYLGRSFSCSVASFVSYRSKTSWRGSIHHHHIMPKQVFKSTKTNRASPVAVGSMQDETSQRNRSRAWNPRDDEILMASRAQGMNWLPIQQAHFPTKTDNACRKRHERLMEKRSAEDWDANKMDNLAKAYLDLRKEMWGMLAERVGEKWQVVEAKVRKHFLTYERESVQG